MALGGFDRIQKICIDCNKTFDTTSPRAKRCPKCAPKFHRARDAERLAATRQRAKLLNSDRSIAVLSLLASGKWRFIRSCGCSIKNSSVIV
jgi:hypothetical protein